MAVDKFAIYEIALAGLLHDIGKLMQRAGLEKRHPEIKNNYNEFCPLSPKNFPCYLHAAHSAYFIEKFIPEGLIDKTELYNAARHHKNLPGDIYKEADSISSGIDRYEDEVNLKGYKEVCMRSVFEEIELQYIIKEEGKEYRTRWAYRPIYESRKNLSDGYPFVLDESEKCAGEDVYYQLWESFAAEVNEIRSIKEIEFYFNELYWLIQKYTSYIPSATNVFPDISLFDHLKTTAAIASALFVYNESPDNNKREFILYGGDISGIQNYIFKIGRVQGIGNIAKRLRGRSFYITMLSEVLSRYVIRRLGFTQTNINFCGGGNFEILLPNTQEVKNSLKDFEKEVNDWLLKNFHGELGFVSAYVKLTKADLKNRYSEKRDELSEEIQISKLKKFYPNIVDKNVWQEDTDFHREVCHSCNMNTVPKGKRFCDLCFQDRRIGELLPQAYHIVFSDRKLSNTSIEFGPFGWVTLLKEAELSHDLIKSVSFIYSLREGSHKDKLIIRSTYYLSQTLPLSLKDMELDTEEDEEGDKMVRTGQVLSFSTLADMSSGDKRIGILKMDVDNLGFIFSLGLEGSDEGKNLPRSISRLANLSRLLFLFFSIYLDRICNEVFERWKDHPDSNCPYRYDVSNIFYVIFSGGDDLVIVGPWDQVIELAWEIQKEFRRFTCQNPNITLSAGIYICKPKYPINHAINKAEEALAQSKSKGKNRITVMGETMVWSEEHRDSKIYQDNIKKYYDKVFTKNELKTEQIYVKDSKTPIFVDTLTFCELKEFADELDSFLKDKKLSRRFLRNLLKAKKVYFPGYYNLEKDLFEESHNLMFLPFLVYNIERNLNKDIKDKFKAKMITCGDAQKYIRQAVFPCRYVLMKNRT